MIGSLLKLLPGWPWFKKLEPTDWSAWMDWPLIPSWEEHPFYLEASKNYRLARLAHQANALKDDLAKAKRLKLKRRHIYAALEANTAERLRVESGQ